MSEVAISLAEFDPGGDMEAACQVWNEAASPESAFYLPMTPELMRERLAGRTGAPAEICLLAMEGGEAVGLAVATATPLAEAEVANLACVAVRPNWRGQGIGAYLLSEVRGRCRKAGRSLMRVDYSSAVRLAHGVDPVTFGHHWLLRQGLLPFRDQLFMRLELPSWEMPGQVRVLIASLEGEGIVFREAQSSDLAALMGTARAFSNGLADTLRRHLESADGAPILIAASGERVLGFVGPLTVSPCGFPDFDLIGVAREERGRGMGKALFHLCLEHFRDRGGQLFELMTAVTNPAQKLYLDAGMKMVGVLVCHEQELG